MDYERSTNVETKALVIPIKFCSFDDFWRIHANTQGPPKPYIGGLSQEREQALKERLRADIFDNHPDGSITLHAKASAVRGIVRKGLKILHRLVHANSLVDGGLFGHVSRSQARVQQPARDGPFSSGPSLNSHTGAKSGLRR